MKACLILMAMIFLVSNQASATSIRPFHTDGCTNFPNGNAVNKLLWRECCVQHDLYLWAGGSKAERQAVDRQLKQCVISKGAPVPAWVMYLGVRIGSQSPVRYKEMEWGNAWNTENHPERARFQPLNPSDIEALARQMNQQSHDDLSNEEVRLFLLNLSLRL